MRENFGKKSENKFIEWSHETTCQSYDILCISDILRKRNRKALIGLDVGGGIGVFSFHLCNILGNCHVTVVDNGSRVSDLFIEHDNTRLVVEDFFNFTTTQKFDFVLMKLVLHHMIGHDERNTYLKQTHALNKAKDLLNDGGVLIVEENLYEGLIGCDFPGLFIYQLTKLNSIEAITRRLGANTAGEGVRFRSLKAWKQLFSESGLHIDSYAKAPSWHWGDKFPLWKRIPLLVTERYQAIFGLMSNGSVGK